MKKILIIEDQEVNIRIYKYILTKIEAEIFYARDGQEAMELALKHIPNIIVSDIQIPKMNGMEVAKKLRQNPDFDKTLLIACTAYSMRGDKEKILSSGFDNYISKPIKPKEFPIILQKYLDEISE